MEKVLARRDCRSHNTAEDSQVKPSLQQGTVAGPVLKWRGLDLRLAAMAALIYTAEKGR